jgi:hypothetical protein
MMPAKMAVWNTGPLRVGRSPASTRARFRPEDYAAAGPRHAPGSNFRSYVDHGGLAGVVEWVSLGESDMSGKCKVRSGLRC